MSKSLQNLIQLNKLINHPYQIDFDYSLSLFDKLTDFITKDHKFAIKSLESDQWVNANGDVQGPSPSPVMTTPFTNRAIS